MESPWLGGDRLCDPSCIVCSCTRDIDPGVWVPPGSPSTVWHRWGRQVSLAPFNPHPPPCRREVPGEPHAGQGCSGEGQRGTAGVHGVPLPPLHGQVPPAAAVAGRGPGAEPAGRGVPVPQAPERGGALQQPPHRDAARQADLSGHQQDSAVPQCLQQGWDWCQGQAGTASPPAFLSDAI